MSSSWIQACPHHRWNPRRGCSGACRCHQTDLSVHWKQAGHRHAGCVVGINELDFFFKFSLNISYFSRTSANGRPVLWGVTADKEGKAANAEGNNKGGKEVCEENRYWSQFPAATATLTLIISYSNIGTANRPDGFVCHCSKQKWHCQEPGLVDCSFWIPTHSSGKHCPGECHGSFQASSSELRIN